MGYEDRVVVETKAHSCKRRECPKCWPSWASWMGRKAGRRMAYGSEVLGVGRAVHVVVSFPPDVPYGTVREYQALRARAIAALKAVGYLGGNLMFHPWRCRDEAGEPLGGRRLQEGGLAIEGPHFHAMTFGWNEDTAAFYRRTGIVVHRIRVLEDEDDVARATAYCLSHVGVGTNFVTGNALEALTWWGVMAPSKLPMPLVPDDVDPEDACPLCGAPMVPGVALCELPDPPPEGDFRLVPPEWVAVKPFAHLEKAKAQARRTFRKMRAVGLVDQTGPSWLWTT